MTPEFLGSIPSSGDLEERFSFLDSEILRANVAIYFRYITFLLALSEESKGESIAYSLYKDIIIYTASIVESLLLYTVERQILHGKADKSVFGKGERSAILATINHDCDEFEESKMQVIKKTIYPKHGTKDRIDFKDITKAAKDARVITKSQFESAEDLRKKRNTIHLSTLTKLSDDYFSKADIEKMFEQTHDIIEAIEKCYSK